MCFDHCIKHKNPKWPPQITKSTIHVAQKHKFGFCTNVFFTELQNLFHSPLNKKHEIMSNHDK